MATNQYRHLGLKYAGDPWTVKQERELILLLTWDFSDWKTIAQLLGRTEGAIICRFGRIAWRQGIDPGNLYSASASQITDIASRVSVMSSVLRTPLPETSRARGPYMVRGKGPPRVSHMNYNDAEREARRLALANPGVVFEVLGVVAFAVAEPAPPPVKVVRL